MSNRNQPEDSHSYLQELKKSGAFNSSINSDKTYLNYIKTQKLDTDYIKSWKNDEQNKAPLPPDPNHR